VNPEFPSDASPSADHRWFNDHVLPHEPMLRAWLRSRFPRGVELDDLVQEAFTRVLRARANGAAMHSPKAFLFATARNLALDVLRHRQVSGQDTLVPFESLDVLDGSDGIPETVDRHEKLERLTLAIQSLPERCREVMTLRKVYGLSQKDIAARLGISECTVSAQLTIGVRKCTESFARDRREAGLR
jgi:RNA polymerase sigma-70 factor (ECF subfamily)